MAEKASTWPLNLRKLLLYLVFTGLMSGHGIYYIFSTSILPSVTTIQLRSVLPPSAIAFRRSIPTRILRFCRYPLAVSLTSYGAWQLWSRHCYFEPFGPENDPLFQSQYVKQFNPRNNPSLNDSCVRKVPISRIDPSLVEDFANGGSKLLERFCSGIWGGYGYAIQRRILNWILKDESNESGMLWSKRQLLESKYEADTTVTDHFIVLEKGSRSIIMRGGMSPSRDPEKPREMDNFAEICVDIDQEQGLAVFRLKNIFFNGVADGAGPGFPPLVVWLHLQYCKLLVEAGVSHCVR